MDDLTVSVEHNERALLAAIYARDKMTMTELMSPDGFGFDAAMGLVRQTDLIDGIGELSSDAGFEVVDLTARHAGPRVVLLAYLLRQWGSFKDRRLPDAVYCSSIWRIENDKWRAMFHHETPVHSRLNHEVLR